MSKLLPDGVGRIELKYRISYFQYLKIRNAVRPYVKMDRFTSMSPEKGYLVRSLYYDTYDYRAYDEKMSGDSERIKYRLRSYSNDLDSESSVKVELKVRKANIVEKFSTPVSVDQYMYFLRHRSWPLSEDPVLIEFERLMNLKDLHPKVLIEYEREGYESRNKDGVRVTFDHKVRTAQAKDLLPRHLFFRVHHPHFVVLEIKLKGNLPWWLSSLARDHGLKVIANSKFTQGIQAARFDLHHPDGVVVIR